MTTVDSLIIFFCSCGILSLAFALAFKGVIAGMVKQMADLVPTYSIAYLKCALGAIIAGGICFKATWQPVTLAQTLTWAWWDWTIHLGEPILTSLIYIQGFLDRSLEKADAAIKAKTESQPPFPMPKIDQS